MNKNSEDSVHGKLKYKSTKLAKKIIWTTEIETKDT